MIGRVRFVFDKEALEIFVSKSNEGTGTETLKQSGQNFAVGGKNRWKYSSFTEWYYY